MGETLGETVERRDPDLHAVNHVLVVPTPHLFVYSYGIAVCIPVWRRWLLLRRPINVLALQGDVVGGWKLIGIAGERLVAHWEQTAGLNHEIPRYVIVE